jgi:hypothetical protein
MNGPINPFRIKFATSVASTFCFSNPAKLRAWYQSIAVKLPDIVSFDCFRIFVSQLVRHFFSALIITTSEVDVHEKRGLSGMRAKAAASAGREAVYSSAPPCTLSFVNLTLIHAHIPSVSWCLFPSGAEALAKRTFASVSFWSRPVGKKEMRINRDARREPVRYVACTS